jgi:ATP-dependent Clp protease ATP-binding subunit ClpC
MYRAWGKNRRMRVQGLQDAPAPGGRSRRLILAVSGYAAFDTLQAETGLHVWEEPHPERTGASVQRTALVRVFPQPGDRVAESETDLLALAHEVEAAAPATTPGVARIYRERPDPLVKDRNRGWRSGRLERVFGGDFDLLGECRGVAGHDRRGNP